MLFPRLLFTALLLLPSLVFRFLVKVFGMDKGPFNIYSIPGLIFVEGLILTPEGSRTLAAKMKGPVVERVLARLRASGIWQ